MLASINNNTSVTLEIYKTENSMQTDICYINKLPIELHWLIVNNLDSESIKKLRLTSRAINKNVTKELLCKQLKKEQAQAQAIITDFLAICYLDESGKVTNSIPNNLYRIMTDDGKFVFLCILMKQILESEDKCKYFLKKSIIFRESYNFYLNKAKISSAIEMFNSKNITTEERDVFIQKLTFSVISNYLSSKYQQKIQQQTTNS